MFTIDMVECKRGDEPCVAFNDSAIAASPAALLIFETKRWQQASDSHHSHSYTLPHSPGPQQPTNPKPKVAQIGKELPVHL